MSGLCGNGKAKRTDGEKNNAWNGALRCVSPAEINSKSIMNINERKNDYEHDYSIFEPEYTYDKIIHALDLLASKRVSKMNKKHTNIPL